MQYSLRLGAAAVIACLISLQTAQAQRSAPAQREVEKFQQLRTQLPTPNTYRTASGAPGHDYWQQRADYLIDVTLDDKNQTLSGSETITYHNNSNDLLDYVWLQLDQNIFQPGNTSQLIESGELNDQLSLGSLSYMMRHNFKGGYQIKGVTDVGGKKLSYTINNTMMRVDLPQPLKPKQKFAFKVSWFNNINEGKKNGGRGASEFFPEDGNWLYEMAQWFPRMAVYDDVNGWQHKQYLGRGEFALEFGDYKVNITVPADHIVTATGELQNAGAVLTATQQQRLEKAKTSKRPVLIVTQDDAEKAEKSKASGTKTWSYLAKNVRDFAWASSRKFIWDAMLVDIEGRKVWAMSFYPKEGNPLWGRYSTEVVAHTLRVYSKHTIPYPYPVAISVHGPIGGMEYPMICFNGGRPEKDGTYSERRKYGMISVIIHEVGHNFFPMIVSSDERQWSWMDEGLNTFCQYLAEQEWQRDYPSSRGEPRDIVSYMKMDRNLLEPIMTNSESIYNFGANAYGKPATALNILRETVMGRKLFDHAFRTYSRRWAFKHPEPADFFRSMEDASGVDLDWFWKGWFYGIEPVDIALSKVSYFPINLSEPEKEKATRKKEAQEKLERSLSYERNKSDIPQTLVEQNPDLKDFYNSYDAFAATDEEKAKFKKFVDGLNPEEKAIVQKGLHLYQVNFENKGGSVMPVIMQFKYEDGTDSTVTIPAEIWQGNTIAVSKVFNLPKPVKEFILDPREQTADIDTENNYLPRRVSPNRFDISRTVGGTRADFQGPNPMQQAKQKQSGNR